MYRLNKGFVTLLVMFVLIILSGIGWELYSKVNTHQRNVFHEAQKLQAAYLADSGLEWARYSLDRDPAWVGGTKKFRDGQVRVEVKTGNMGYQVSSRAEVGITVQKRSGVFASDANGVLMLTHYEERYD